MEFWAFAERVADIEAETADLEVGEQVASLLGAAGEALPVAARFVRGRVLPAWPPETLEIGPQLCYAALARAAGPNVSVEDADTKARVQSLAADAVGSDPERTTVAPIARAWWPQSRRQ